MDEEQQTLASPLAGSIRGIRRSVSSNVFSGRALPQQVSDPQQTSLLNQNSLTLTNVSSQLSGINERVSNKGRPKTPPASELAEMVTGMVIELSLIHI